MTERRLCIECRTVELHGRADQLTCSRKCRQARARFNRRIHGRLRAGAPLRIAYGDPPYPRKAKLYKGHRDFRGEVDHAALLAHLRTYDGWALSTDEEGLRTILPLLAGIDDYRIAVWVRGARPGASAGPAHSFEVVIYKPARTETSRSPAIDSLVCVPRARTSNADRVIGAKPPEFWSWLFALLDARAGDLFDDLFPGSGDGARAWAAYCDKAAA